MSTKVIFRREEVFRDVRMQVNLGLMFERKAKISCNGGRSRLDVCVCGRLGRQTSARTKTFARLKITFVDMTYPGQRPEPPSLSPHFLLLPYVPYFYWVASMAIPIEKWDPVIFLCFIMLLFFLVGKSLACHSPPKWYLFA